METQNKPITTAQIQRLKKRHIDEHDGNAGFGIFAKTVGANNWQRRRFIFGGDFRHNNRKTTASRHVQRVDMGNGKFKFIHHKN